MEYHRFITEAGRDLTAADRMDVFGGGTDPAGLGTLGAPVNPAHVFEYLGENLPAFGNPQDVVGAGAQSWEPGFENVYSGKYITEEQSRLAPNTTTITIADSTPVVMRPDELTSVKNNAQIMREKTVKSVRTYRANPSADVLAQRVNADAEARNIQDQAVSLVYESQMDVIRAKHLGAQSRGAALRGEHIGAMTVSSTTFQTPTILKSPTTTATKPSVFQRMGKSLKMPVSSSPAVDSGPQMLPSSNSSTVQSEESSNVDQGYSEMVVSAPYEGEYETGTYTDSSLEPTKIVMILGGVAVAAAAAYFLMRK